MTFPLHENANIQRSLWCIDLRYFTWSLSPDTGNSFHFSWEDTVCVNTEQSSSSYRLHCMLSHLIASSPARCRVVRPPRNLDRGQSFTIWLI